ncbi:MAG: hypothetical protein EPN38_11020 [Rhodanobacteraceae bacterium]|nr:MAG: hypothetical protein EPN38_11020 [Rhodanobacteraceae bacterium]
MHSLLQLKTWSHGLRLAALAAGVMGLAGCMAGYSYVQPGIAGAGGYYSGDAAYPTYYPTYYGGDGYAYGAPYTSLSLSIGSGWGPGYYGGYGYGYAYPGYYRGRSGHNWHGGYGNHGGYHGGHAWRPTGAGGSVDGGYAPAPHGYRRAAPRVRPSGRPGEPSIRRP